MKTFYKKFGVMMFAVALIAAFGLVVFVNRASAAMVTSTPLGYFQAESPINSQPFRIDEPKTFSLPVTLLRDDNDESGTLIYTEWRSGPSCLTFTGNRESQFPGKLFVNGVGTTYSFTVDAATCPAGTSDSIYRLIHGGSEYVDVEFSVTIKPRAPIITLSPLSLTLAVTPFYPTAAGSFAISNTGDKNTTLNWSAAKASVTPPAGFISLPHSSFSFSPAQGSVSINASGGSSPPSPVNVSVDGNLLTANGYAPGTYTGAIRVSDNVSTPNPAENAPKDLAITVNALAPGVAVPLTPTGGFTYNPLVLSAATSQSPATANFALSAPLCGPGIGCLTNVTFDYGAGECRGGPNGENIYTTSVWSGSGESISFVVNGVPFYCPDFTNHPKPYAGTLTVSSQNGTARVPYTVTVTANPINVTTNPVPPSPTPDLTFDSAVLRGRVAASAPVWAGFQYSKKPFDPTTPGNFGTQTPLQRIATPGSGTNFSNNLSYALDGDTYYYFRAVAYPDNLDLSKVSYGSTMFFRTPAVPPITITCEQNCNFTASAGGASASYSLWANTRRSYNSSNFNPSTGETTYTSFRAEVSVTKSQNWLSLSPALLTVTGGFSSGFATSSFSMTINPGVLTAGSYQDRVVVTVTESFCQGAGCAPSPTTSYSRSIPVNLAVSEPVVITRSDWDIYPKASPDNLKYDYNNDGFLSRPDLVILVGVIGGLQSCPQTKNCDVNNRDGSTPTTSDYNVYTTLMNTFLVANSSCTTPPANCNYTASGLAAGDYQANLQITNSLRNTDFDVKNFKVNPSISVSVASVTVTPADYCVSGPAATVNWTLSGSGIQSAYQVQVNNAGSAWNPPLTIDSGKVTGSGTSYFTGDSIPPWAWQTTYKARVRVWDSNDVVSIWRESDSWATPKHAYPTVNFTWSPLQPAVNQSVQFTDQTVFGSDSGGVGQQAWDWLFKSPAATPSSTRQNPTYTYDSVGSYNVKLTVTDKDGLTCFRTKILGVARPIPIWKEVSPK